jgi:beta-fructofuranosidase/levanase/fructan beta-fructosidase
MKFKKHVFLLKSLLMTILIIGCSNNNSKKPEVMSTEKYRPAYHFTPDENWMNDPNGMVFYEGEYHLFYQFNPFGNTWGHMSWGHAVSKDLVKWEHLPLALAEENDIMIFSGSAVVDWNNSSGFGIDNKPPLVAIYTGHEEKNRKQYQSIAYSNDKGRTWTKYEQNPVLDIGMKDFRDPKVFWYEPEKKWVMVVALSLERKLHLYSSTNLKDWDFLSEFGPQNAVDGIWECPDLFEMKANDGKNKWVLGINLGRHSVAGGSGGQYLVGTFNGKEFIADESSISEIEKYTPPSTFIASTKNSSNEKLSQETASLLNSDFFILDDDKKRHTSKPFEITADYLNFSLATLANSEEHIPNLELWIDNELIRNSANNELNLIEWKAWNLEDYIGKTAQLKIDKTKNEEDITMIIDQLHQNNKAAYSETEKTQWMDYGTDFYAAVSWSDIPKEDGRRLWIGWMNNWHYANEIPSGKWRSSMSIARSLELVKKETGYQLVQHPVEEIKEYRTAVFETDKTTINDFNNKLNDLNLSDQFEAVFEVELQDLEQIKMLFGDSKKPAILWEYDSKTELVSTERFANGNEYFHPKFSNHQQFKVEPESGILTVRLFVDRNSLEIFHQKGKVVSTQLMYPINDDFKWVLKANNLEAELKNVSLYKHQ